MWVPGLIALLLGEALLLYDRNVAVAYAATAVALAATARAIEEQRLQWAAIVLLGGNTAVTLVALTPPSHLIEASDHPGTSGWTIAARAVAWGVIATLEPRLRERLGWLAAALGLYTASLLILEVAERVSGASAQTDFERGHTAVSALWGAVGLGLLVAGLLRDSRALRLGGLALFGISLAKLFLYDLSTLSSVTRAFSFLAVGAILLAGGFFLQKLSRRLDQPRWGLRAWTIAACSPSATGCVKRTSTPSRPAASSPADVFPPRERTGDAAGPAPSLSALAGVSQSSATTSLIPIRPPGLSTRAISAKHRRLVAGEVDHAVRDDDVDALSWQRDRLDVPLQEVGVGHARLGGVSPRQREHLVGHVEAVGDARRRRRAAPRAARRCRHPEPRSSTVSPSRSSATAVGLPQPRLASRAASGGRRARKSS